MTSSPSSAPDDVIGGPVRSGAVDGRDRYVPNYVPCPASLLPAGCRSARRGALAHGRFGSQPLPFQPPPPTHTHTNTHTEADPAGSFWGPKAKIDNFAQCTVREAMLKNMFLGT